MLNLKKSKLILMGLVAAMILLILGCSGKTQEIDKEKAATGTLKYKVVNTSNTANLPDELAEWYLGNYQDKGLHSLNLEGSTYLLVSTGEKPTEGYGIDQLTLTGTETQIEVSGTLRVPGQNEMVGQVITYPNILVKIPEDSRQFKLIELKDTSPAANSAQKDTGTYVGQIDSNSIEIKISGVPEPKAARAFQLADMVKDNFDRFGLETGDQVLFSFFKNDNGQLVLTSIEKIQN